MDVLEETSINAAKTEIGRILQEIETAHGPIRLRRHISAARAAIRSVDTTSLMDQPDRIRDQAEIVNGLHRIAYHHPDSGGVQDIAEWCVAQWLRVLQHNSESVEALQGMGQAWLSRAQAALARIHREEGSSSSGSGCNRPGTSGSNSYTPVDDARDAARAATEAYERMHSADYVEARGILLPSTEYFARAVTSADRQSLVMGNLLALAAESFMSLGNVSYPSANERYFRQALLYLRRASQLPGFTLSSYLQAYLEDYGRLVD